MATAALPILGVWLLLSPPTMLSQEMTWDLLFNLSGAWHLYWGHVAHVDFHDPVGELNFMLTVLGFHVVGLTPKAFVIGEVVAAFVVFIAASLSAWRRLPPIAAGIFAVFVTLLVLAPVNIGDPLNVYSFAMAYNRYGWSALCILCLLAFLPPRGARGDAIDASVFLGLLIALFYIKITYFAAGLATLGVAMVFSEHVHRRWWLWCLVGTIAVLNAVAPYSHAYMKDVLSAAEAGGVRSGIAFHLNRFLSHASEYAPYVSATVFAIWLWLTHRAPKRLPAAIAFVAVIGFMMLSQNAQSHGLPVAIVIAFLLYAHEFRTRPQSNTRMLSLIALLVFPVLEVGALTFSLTGYWLKAGRIEELTVLRGTNLNGLAVPSELPGLLTAVAAGKADYTMLNRLRAVRPRFELSQAEYAETLDEAAQLIRSSESPHVVILDQVNPLPFMLGLAPPRHGNLWSGLGAPQRAAEEIFSEATDVLIPKFSTYGRWTAKAIDNYSNWLDSNFPVREETKSWILLRHAVHQPSAVRLGTRSYPE